MVRVPIQGLDFDTSVTLSDSITSLVGFLSGDEKDEVGSSEISTAITSKTIWTGIDEEGEFGQIATTITSLITTTTVIT